MGRLIDADRLKEVFIRNVAGGNAYFDLIDNVSTVEAYSKDVVIAMLIQILDEISNKTAITKDSKDKIACALADGWNNSQLRDCEIIRTKIAELRGQTNVTTNSTVI